MAICVVESTDRRGWHASKQREESVECFDVQL
jgi:hypothetical protein